MRDDTCFTPPFLPFAKVKSPYPRALFDFATQGQHSSDVPTSILSQNLLMSDALSLNMHSAYHGTGG